MAYFVDGRATAVVGTHTHAPTADQRVLPGGTAYISDAGMCGDYNSVLGMDTDEPLNRFLTKIPRTRLSPPWGLPPCAGSPSRSTMRRGWRRKVSAFRRGPHLEPAEPGFWED